MSKLHFRFVEINHNDIRLAVIIKRHRLIGIYLNIEEKIKIARMRQLVFRVKLCDIRKPYLPEEDNVLGKQFRPPVGKYRRTEKLACTGVVISIRLFYFDSDRIHSRAS